MMETQMAKNMENDMETGVRELFDDYGLGM